MRKELLLFSFTPASCSGFLSTNRHFFFRDVINFGRALSAIGSVFVGEFFFLKKLLVSLLGNFYHFYSFLLAGLARGLILVSFYVIFVAKLLLRGSGFFDCEFYFNFFNLHCSPFYRQFFNLLPLLLCFYYSTLACNKSIVFSKIFDDFLINFPQGGN